MRNKAGDKQIQVGVGRPVRALVPERERVQADEVCFCHKSGHAELDAKPHWWKGGVRAV